MLPNKIAKAIPSVWGPYSLSHAAIAPTAAAYSNRPVGVVAAVVGSVTTKKAANIKPPGNNADQLSAMAKPPSKKPTTKRQSAMRKISKKTPPTALAMANAGTCQDNSDRCPRRAAANGVGVVTAETPVNKVFQAPVSINQPSKWPESKQKPRHSRPWPD